MADSSPFALAGNDSSLPNARVLDVENGLELKDTGGGGTLTVAPAGNLKTLANFDTQCDFIAFDTTDKIITGELQEGTGIELTRPEKGAVNISVLPNTTLQLSAVEVGDVPVVPGRSIFNFTSSGSASVSVTDTNGKANINIDASSEGASVGAKYILQTADEDLPNAQALGALSTGLMKVTTSTGVVSTAVAGTDYQAPSAILTSIAGVTPTKGTQLVADGTGFEGIAAGPSGYIWTSGGSGNTPSWQEPSSGGENVVICDQEDVLINMVPGTTYITSNLSGDNDPQEFGIGISLANPRKFSRIKGYGSAGWTVSTEGQEPNITAGTLTFTGSGVGPSIQSTLPTDSIDIYCIDSNNFLIEIISGEPTFITP